MSRVIRGSVTFLAASGTGNKTISLPDATFLTNRIAVAVVTNSGNERSVGGGSLAHNYAGNFGTYSDVSNTKSIFHYRNIGGTKTKTIEGHFASSVPGDVVINLSTLTENTRVEFAFYED